jgi:peptidoglycan/LPS O-acetylase OafA/YrhL
MKSDDAFSGRFASLDAIRGIAALLVAGYHFGQRFGGFVPEGYLAVDLFFALSGFVIALSYSEKLARGLTLTDFGRRRLIRLYPLYLLGLFLGIMSLAALAIRHPDASLSLSKLGVSSGLGVIMLPAVLGERGWFTGPLYPLNGPVWSLAIEASVNFVFALGLYRVASKWLVSICICAAAYLMLHLNSPLWANMGWGWGWSNLGGGIARALFSFPLGMLIWRWVRVDGRRESHLAFAVFTIVAALLCAYPHDSYRKSYELGAIFVAFPILIVAGIMFEPPRWFRPYALWLGDISYAVYAIHWPLIAATGFVFEKAGLARLGGLVVFLAICTVGGMAAHFAFDVPVRNLLSRRSNLADRETRT